jgi:hypothetical protein
VALGAVAVRPNDSNAASSDGSGNCSAGPGSVSFGDEMTSGGHPAKAFFGPDKPPPGGGDLQHVIGDGRRLESPAPVADGNHGRADRFVSLGVVTSAALVALGAEIADPLIGLLITMVILKVTWDSWRTVRGR